MSITAQDIYIHTWFSVFALDPDVTISLKKWVVTIADTERAKLRKSQSWQCL